MEIDVPRETGFELLSGQRVGLVTDLAGENFEGVARPDLFDAVSSGDLAALFRPEPVIRRQQDDGVSSEQVLRAG